MSMMLSTYTDLDTTNDITIPPPDNNVDTYIDISTVESVTQEPHYEYSIKSNSKKRLLYPNQYQAQLDYKFPETSSFKYLNAMMPYKYIPPDSTVREPQGLTVITHNKRRETSSVSKPPGFSITEHNRRKEQMLNNFRNRRNQNANQTNQMVRHPKRIVIDEYLAEDNNNETISDYFKKNTVKDENKMRSLDDENVDSTKPVPPSESGWDFWGNIMNNMFS
jgi:hypothetical protein